MGERKNTMQSRDSQPISEASAASHILHVSLCEMRTKCEGLGVYVAQEEN